jgi:hypothetical protein
LDVECVRDASLTGLGADQIAVVENHSPRALESKHRAHVPHDRRAAFLHQGLRITLPHPPHFGEATTGRDIAVNQIVRGGLVGDHVGDDAAREQRFVDIRRVA